MKDPMVPPGVTQASSPGVPARVAAGPAQSPGGRAKLQARTVVVTDVTKHRPNGLPPSRPGTGELRGVRSRLSDQVVCPGRRAGAVARQGGAGRRRPWRPRTCPAQSRRSTGEVTRRQTIGRAEIPDRSLYFKASTLRMRGLLATASPVQLLRFSSRTSTVQTGSENRRRTAGRGCTAPSGLGIVLLAGEDPSPLPICRRYESSEGFDRH